ncbi:MAG: RNA polymerase sigma factor [Gaiellaceae bacterium]|jgi:RNA polymerase sigma-70 factor (ECF subfamily)
MDRQTRAIEDVYSRRYQAFRGALAGIAGSYELAHDVVQESFARALKRRADFRRDGPLEAWIWKIALRVAYEMRGPANELELADAFEPSLPQPERDEALAAALHELSPRRRLVVFLRYVADLDYRDIARVCEISEGTVAATLAQAKAALAASLDRSNQGPCELREAAE